MVAQTTETLLGGFFVNAGTIRTTIRTKHDPARHAKGHTDGTAAPIGGEHAQ